MQGTSYKIIKTSTKSFVLIPLISFILLSSCKHSDQLLPASAGKTGQLIIVIEGNYWNGSIGDSLRSTFQEEILGLPQVEPCFDISQVYPSYFNNMINIQRNILIAEIKNGPSKVEIKKNVWSSPQIVVWLTAPNENEWHKLFSNNKEKIKNLFLMSDRQRLMEAYSQSEDPTITATIKDKFGFNITFPKGYRIIKDINNFMWIRYENMDLNQSVLIYNTDYRDTSQFSTKNIIAFRDSICKLNVPGPLPGTYMMTEKLFIPIRTELNFKDEYAVEHRGLWKVYNDYMGGPFVNISFVNKKDNKFISVDAFIYAPKLEKRLYLRQLEAILYSIKFD